MTAQMIEQDIHHAGHRNPEHQQPAEKGDQQHCWAHDKVEENEENDTA